VSKRTSTLLGLLAAIALVAAACSSNETPSSQGTTPPATSPPATSPPATSPPATTAGVTVKGTDQLTFDPKELTVKVGETVTWLNGGSVAHTVTFTNGPTFDKTLNEGEVVTRTFDTAGTFAYFCKVHGQSMSGKIIVT
jgi:plastocyanin